MKFGNGCWLYKEGCEGFSPAEVSDVRIGGDSAVLLMPAESRLPVACIMLSRVGRATTSSAARKPKAGFHALR